MAGTFTLYVFAAPEPECVTPVAVVAKVRFRRRMRPPGSRLATRSNDVNAASTAKDVPRTAENEPSTDENEPRTG